MIGQIISTPYKTTVIKPIHNSIEADDLWELFNSCGFNDVYVICYDGYDNAIEINGYKYNLEN